MPIILYKINVKKRTGRSYLYTVKKGKGISKLWYYFQNNIYICVYIYIYIYVYIYISNIESTSNTTSVDYLCVEYMRNFLLI